MSTITLRPVVQGVVAQEGALVINLDDSSPKGGELIFREAE